MFGDYLACVHVKSAMPVPAVSAGPQELMFIVVRVALKAGMVICETVFKALKAVGYDGWLSLEGFWPPAWTTKL